MACHELAVRRPYHVRDDYAGLARGLEILPHADILANPRVTRSASAELEKDSLQTAREESDRRSISDANGPFDHRLLRREKFGSRPSDQS